MEGAIRPLELADFPGSWKTTEINSNSEMTILERLMTIPRVYYGDQSVYT